MELHFFLLFSEGTKFFSMQSKDMVLYQIQDDDDTKRLTYNLIQKGYKPKKANCSTVSKQVKNPSYFQFKIYRYPTT